MVRVIQFVLIALLSAACFAEDEPEEFALESSKCCSPDLIFIIDITDGIGFSRSNCESHIRDFLKEIYKRTARRRCDEVHAAIIEYGTQARIKFDFKKYDSGDELEGALRRYTPGNSLGGTSSAKSGFSGARILLSNPSRGRRDSSTATIFWLVHSNPSDASALENVVSEIKGFERVQIIVVAVGDNVDHSLARSVATSRHNFYGVDDVSDLLEHCKRIKVDYCPSVKPRTTTTKATTTTEPVDLPEPTTPEPTTRKTRRTTTTTEAATPSLPDITIPDAVPADDFCFGCRSRRNNKDLYADSTECHHYYQCFYLNETSAFGIRRVCPVGTFWHDSVLQCMPEGDVPCIDRCMDDATSASGCYAGSNCREYFVCANTASYGMCCPEGTEFVANGCSCVESTTCTANCVQRGPTVPTTVAPANSFNSTVCRDSWGTYISSVSGEPNAFLLIDDEGNPTVKQYCPTGVNFDLGTCSCSVYDENAAAPDAIVQRRALVWLTFDSDTSDQSINKWATFLYDGAERDASAAAFGGGSLYVNNGHLSIPGLKTFDFRSTGSWCGFFRCESGSNFGCATSGGILSNNKDSSSSEYTVILGTQASNSFTGRLNFWHPVGAQAVNSAISPQANGWNHFCVVYNSNAITLYLNGAVADSENVGGYLSIAHCPYVIGHDQGLGYFNGHIDDVLITDFAMTQDEVDAHRSGDRAFLRSRGFF